MSAIIQSLIRQGLTAVGGSLATTGWLSGADVQSAVGAIMTILSIAWSVYDKRKGQ